MNIHYLKSSQLTIQRICFYAAMVVSLLPYLQRMLQQSPVEAGSFLCIYVLQVVSVLLTMGTLYVGGKSFTLPALKQRIHYKNDTDGKRYFKYSLYRILFMVSAPVVAWVLVLLGTESASYLGLMSFVMLLFVYPTQGRYLRESGQLDDLEEEEQA
jgi:uncharacterized membrane protein